MTNSDFLGCKLTDLTNLELQGVLSEAIKAKRKISIFHLNVHALELSRRDVAFRSILNSGNVVFADSRVVLVAARLCGVTVREQVRYIEWIWDLAALCQENNFSVFFLGGRKGIAEIAARRIKDRFPGLNITGTHEGYFTKVGSENQAVIGLINSLKPDILFVGFGMPLQERWIAKNSQEINTHAFLSCGALFDRLAGRMPVAPRAISKFGLEWLYYLLFSPGRRIFRRVFLEGPVFVSRIIGEKVKKIF
jgi:N-acetylglucosaminyldiphosphoundecaprenol N-acetyl-beta-D-mannosaminyltransferase